MRLRRRPRRMPVVHHHQGAVVARRPAGGVALDGRRAGGCAPRPPSAGAAGQGVDHRRRSRRARRPGRRPRSGRPRARPRRPRARGATVCAGRRCGRARPAASWAGGSPRPRRRAPGRSADGRRWSSSQRAGPQVDQAEGGGDEEAALAVGAHHRVEPAQDLLRARASSSTRISSAALSIAMRRPVDRPWPETSAMITASSSLREAQDVEVVAADRRAGLEQGGELHALAGRAGRVGIRLFWRSRAIASSFSSASFWPPRHQRLEVGRHLR